MRLSDVRLFDIKPPDDWTGAPEAWIAQYQQFSDDGDYMYTDDAADLSAECDRMRQELKRQTLIGEAFEIACDAYQGMNKAKAATIRSLQAKVRQLEATIQSLQAKGAAAMIDIDRIVAENLQMEAERRLFMAERDAALAKAKALEALLNTLSAALENERSRGFDGETMLFYAPSKAGHATCDNIAKWIRAQRVAL